MVKNVKILLLTVYIIFFEMSIVFCEVRLLKNVEVRTAARSAGVKLWKIAEALGIADCSFSRRLRKELPSEEKNRIMQFIDELSKEEINESKPD
jgi:thioredoxin-related protein